MFGRTVRSTWDNDGRVWLQTRLLRDTPEPTWGWIERQDPRVWWKDIREVIRTLEIDTPHSGTGGAFAILKQTPHNKTIADSLAHLPFVEK